MARKRSATVACFNAWLSFLSLGVAAAIALGVIGMFYPTTTRVAVKVETLPSGNTECVGGTAGTRLTFCVDNNNDADCDYSIDTITAVQLICSGQNGEDGAAGAAGADGAAGANGTSVLVEPVKGWVAFWWNNPAYGNSPAWGNFDTEFGNMIGPPIGYVTTDARTGGKLQYGKGNGTYTLTSIMNPFIAPSKRFLFQLNTLSHIYIETELQANPAGHNTPTLVSYDKLHDRYVAMATLTSPNRYGLVTIDISTGVIMPFTGTGGLSGPADDTELDMTILGDYIFVSVRKLGKVFLNAYNRTDGQYISSSTFNGTVVTYPNTLEPLWIGENLDENLWIISFGYDESNIQLNVVLGGEGGGGVDRGLGWVNATSEQELASRLLSGNYDIYLTRDQPTQTLNAGTFIDHS